VPVAIFLFLVFGLFDRTARGTVGCSWKGGSEGEKLGIILPLYLCSWRFHCVSLEGRCCFGGLMCSLDICCSSFLLRLSGTRNVLTFVNTTAIA